MATESTQSTSAAWPQFLLARRKVLDDYERAVAHAKTQPVPVHHGNVGEAAVRAWLSAFLPTRFGVTSGYIRAQGLPSPFQSSHLDVIVYDQIEAPILWIEDNPDKAEQGRSRIIPCEHVRAVLEVKSAFSRRSVGDAIDKLGSLAPLCAGLDASDERYPKFLAESAVFGMVFIELREADRDNWQALDLFRTATFGRPFCGGLVLRGDGRGPDDSAIVTSYHSDEAFDGLKIDRQLLGHVAMTATIEVSGNNVGAMLKWDELNFSQFSFDLLALLKGTYLPGLVSSYHGLDFSRLVREATAIETDASE